MGLKAGITLLAVALILVFIAFFVNFCMMIQCTGWNWFNPLCHGGYINCELTQGTMKLVMLMGAFVLFLGGIWGIVTSGGKKKK